MVPEALDLSNNLLNEARLGSMLPVWNKGKYSGNYRGYYGGFPKLGIPCCGFP